MSNKQKWAVIIMSFVLLTVLVVGGYAYGITKSIERIMASPAATSEFDIDADIMMTMSDETGLQVEYIHLNRISGKLNSKIIDLILLAINGN